MINSKMMFRNALFAMTNRPQSEQELTEQNKTLWQTFLTYGSETPCNLACAAHIEYGWVTERDYSPRTCGLKIKGTDLLVSDVIHWAAETDAFTKIAQAEFPQLTTAQCEAVTRITAVILLSLEYDEGN